MGEVMELKEAIEHSKKKPGMKVCFAGVMRNGPGRSYMRNELGKHFEQARKAWIEGDLETVAEFFGLYV